MKIQIVTPASRGSRKGNRITAERWAKFCGLLGHRVTVSQEWNGDPCDVLLALHARKSANSIDAFRKQYGTRKIILMITGTDIYGRPSKVVARSMQLADRIVVLQPSSIQDLSPNLRRKTHVIFQSAVAPRTTLKRLRSVFEVSVVGHLRPVKDPFRVVMASRLLPPTSKIRVVQIGSALSLAMERQANRYVETDDRYRWLGGQPHSKTLQRLARSRLLVLPSKSEGGASAIAESLVCGVPVLATRVAGNVGMLGSDYPGLFEVGDTLALARLMSRCESDADFYQDLCKRGKELSKRFRPPIELAAIRRLLQSL